MKHVINMSGAELRAFLPDIADHLDTHVRMESKTGTVDMGKLNIRLVADDGLGLWVDLDTPDGLRARRDRYRLASTWLFDVPADMAREYADAHMAWQVDADLPRGVTPIAGHMFAHESERTAVASMLCEVASRLIRGDAYVQLLDRVRHDRLSRTEAVRCAADMVYVGFPMPDGASSDVVSALSSTAEVRELLAGCEGAEDLVGMLDAMVLERDGATATDSPTP